MSGETTEKGGRECPEKVVAMLGGLGSQMMKYSFALWLKEQGADCAIDSSGYLILNSWNGYELKKLFNVSLRDICDEYETGEREAIESKQMSPWEVCFSHFGSEDGAHYRSGKLVREKRDNKSGGEEKPLSVYISKALWAWKYLVKKRIAPGDSYDENFFKDKRLCWVDDFEHISDRYLCKDKERLMQVFSFPELTDEKDLDISGRMLKEDSVAMHIRRSDHMYDQAELFRRKYFAKSLDHIRRQAKGRIAVYVFSEALEWCRENAGELGILPDDECVFVDWHMAEESFRDMQLMTYCRHNILAKSSFAFWGYYLSKWETGDKVIVAPKKYWPEVSVHI